MGAEELKNLESVNVVMWKEEEKFPPTCPECGQTLYRVAILDYNVMDYDFDEERYIEDKAQREYRCFYCNENVTDLILDFLLGGGEDGVDEV